LRAMQGSYADLFILLRCSAVYVALHQGRIAGLCQAEQEVPMTAIAFVKVVAGQNAVATQSAATPAKGILSRIMDAIVAARAAQAEREVARYLATRDFHSRY